jgi:OmpA-OmpF porin, OOP family
MLTFKRQGLAAVAVALGLAAATSALAQQGRSTEGYLTDFNNQIVKDPYNLCWRRGTWTPALAHCECDPDLIPRDVCFPPPPKPAAAPPAPAPAPAPVPVAPAPKPAPKPVTEKVTFAADVFFDFDKAVLKPEGKAALDGLVGKLQGVTLEVIIAIGHTDSVGSSEYNQALSVRRAEAVKAYLVSKGIEPNRIYTEGKGKTQPIASNSTDAGRAKNRRTEIEVVGTRMK